MAKPYQEGKGWCVRKRFKGHDIYLSGHETKGAVEQALRAEIKAIERSGKPQHLGPHRSTLAYALQDYGREHLRRLKGASQEARRINKYLQAAGLQLLAICPAPASSNLHFAVELLPLDTQRKVPPGLGPRRKALLCKTADSDRLRQILSQKSVSDITRSDIQQLMDSLASDGLAASTVALERALLRSFFNYARKRWGWSQPSDNPATDLVLVQIDNARDRVMSLQEQELLDQAFDTAHNDVLRHVVVLLRETAMRASEPLLHATWECVDWERKVLQLSDGKDGKRDVPLSPLAIDALKALGPGEAEQRIVELTYEALKAGFRRTCERAGVENLHLHDLRHTAATRLGLETGNLFLVKALTGHKTDAMVARYVNVKAEDVVNHFHRKRDQAPQDSGALVEEESNEPAQTPVAMPGFLDAAQMQALVAKAVSDAMSKALLDAQAPTQATRSVETNVVALRRAA
jgi:integrase